MKRLLLCSSAIAALASPGQTQSIVYDNTTNSLHTNMPLLPAWRDNSAEAGDEVWLTGTDRQVTQLRLLFSYRGTAPGTIDARIRFRTVDPGTEKPGDAFYESALIVGLPTVGGMNEYIFAIPNVVVPDRFVWTVQAYNRQGSVGELGPAYYNPATVGWSDDFYWQSDMGSEWIAYSWGGDPYANFAATITAVPEPASMLALAAGVGIFLRRRRSR
jgi:hypothetical protein